MNRFSKKQIVWFVVIVLVAIGGYFFFIRQKGKALQDTVTVKRGDVVQEVSVTGRVKPTTVVDMSFEKQGRIQGVYTRVGAHVAQGDLLAEVESSGAQASLMEAQARLAELKRGSRPEEIAVKEAELAKYSQDLTNSYGGVLDIINDAFTKSDDALHAKMTGIFSGFKTSAYKFTYQICDSQLDLNGAALRYTSEGDLDQWRSEVAALSASPTNADLSTLLDKAGKHLDSVKTFLDAVNRTLTLDCTTANTALDTYRTNVNTARTNITTASTNVNAKKQAIAALALSVAKVRDELSLMKAGTASEVIAAQEARVLSAEGDLRKYRIYAPISGTITKVSAIIGESSNTTAHMISVISDSSFEIEANVPEADIAKVKIAANAKVTLDAYGPDVLFASKVTAIDPAETIIDNVPTYKVTFHFLDNDPRIRSGMTANIDISADSRKNVLRIPQRAIITRDNTKLVRIVDSGGTTTEKSIMVGLKGSDGSIELVSGLDEGTTIVASPTE